MNQHLPPPDLPSAIAALTALLGDRAVTGQSVRDLHARDESHHAPRLPDVVVFPQSTQEVADIVRIAARHRLPIVPFGAGSGLEGGAIPVEGGISLDSGRLNRIIEIREDDMIVRVEAGVRRRALNRQLRDTGLFFPIDPGADASIGGMAATGASGTNAVRFGVMRENVLGLTVVTADGRIVRTGSLARKSSSGYDLTRLFIGSEGTLGIITEITLRLHPVPDAVSATVGFSTLDGAVAAVTDIKRAGLSIGRVELVDAPLVAVINRNGALALDPLPTLFFEFQGCATEVAALAGTVEEIVASHGGMALHWARTDAEAKAIWETRYVALAWAKAERPGAHSWPTDVCVPISALADAVLQTRTDVEASGLTAHIVGHVGDGNFHCVFLIDPTDPAEEAEVQRIADRIVERALAVGGTASGEHGVGLGKRDVQEAEHGPEAVALMQALKATLDPLGILNPGKVLPDRTAASPSFSPSLKELS